MADKEQEDNVSGGAPQLKRLPIAEWRRYLIYQAYHNERYSEKKRKRKIAKQWKTLEAMYGKELPYGQAPYIVLTDDLILYRPDYLDGTIVPSDDVVDTSSNG